VYVVAKTGADAFILARANETFGYLSDGNDGFCLVKGDESSYSKVDCVGTFDGDPGAGWAVCGVNEGTLDHTLVRKSMVTMGNGGNWARSAGTTTENCEWEVLPTDEWTYAGSHPHSLSAGRQPSGRRLLSSVTGQTESSIGASLALPRNTSDTTTLTGKLEMNGVKFLNCTAEGKGGALFVGMHHAVMIAGALVDGCTSYSGGAAFVDKDVIASVDNSTFRGCHAADGGAFELNGHVSIVLTNVSMEHNHAFGSRGGAIDAAAAGSGINMVTIRRGSFINNSAAEYGGTACLGEGSELLVESAVISGSSSKQGAGIYAREESTLNLRHLVVKNGHATAGGAIYLDESVASLYNVSMLGNQADMLGGAIFADSSPALTVIHSHIAGNHANIGGGVYVLHCMLTFFHSSFFENEALLFGGALQAESECMIECHNVLVKSNIAGIAAGGFSLYENNAMTASNTSFFRNEAGVNGGGIQTARGNVVLLIDSVMEGNIAETGGGFSGAHSRLEVVRCVIDNNLAWRGGGLAMDGLDATASLTLSHTSVSHNEAANNCGGVLVQGTHSIFSAQNCSINTNIGSGLCFFLAKNVDINGSSISWNTADEGAGIHALKSHVGLSAAKILNNRAIDDGGGFLLRDSLLRASDTTIVSNSAHNNGGGLAILEGSNALLRSSALRGNTAVNGGGCYLVRGCFQADSVDISVNSARESGGGIFALQQSNFTGRHTVVSNNSALAHAGGIYATDRVVIRVTDCRMESNNAGKSGGAIFTSMWSDLTAERITLSNNMALYDGGSMALSVQCRLELKEALHLARPGSWSHLWRMPCPC